MPRRSVANNRQRQLFADLSQLNGIALTTKNTDLLSVNIHGAFTLFDKHWPMAGEDASETMIALQEEGLEQKEGEPAVHFHVDWQAIRWARIQPRYLELISTDYEIVFAGEKDGAARTFWFYLREGIDTQLLIANWGYEWINLEGPAGQKKSSDRFKATANSQRFVPQAQTTGK